MLHFFPDSMTEGYHSSYQISSSLDDCNDDAGNDGIVILVMVVMIMVVVIILAMTVIVMLVICVMMILIKKSFQASWILLLLGYVFVPIYLKGGVSISVINRYQVSSFVANKHLSFRCLPCQNI